MGLFDFFKRNRAPEAAKEPFAIARAGPKAEPIILPPEPTTAKELSEKFTYARPLIISVDGTLAEIPMDSRSVGKFVLCADNDSVRFFGILYLGLAHKRSDLAREINHKDFYAILSSISPSYLEGFGTVLGGGELIVDFEARKMLAQGYSGFYGRPPKSFVKKALVIDGYSVQALLGESAGPDQGDNPAAVEWFARRGVSIAEPWSTE